MRKTPKPWTFLVVAVAGWINRRQQEAIDYLREENCVLREQLGRRPRFTDNQRRRLAAKGKPLGRRLLEAVATLVTPETILGWYRDLIARQYDGSPRREPGRPPKPRGDPRPGRPDGEGEPAVGIHAD